MTTATAARPATFVPLSVLGSTLAVGSVAWATGTVLGDPAKIKSATDSLESATALLFQIGLAALLVAYARTGAAGGRRARVVLRVEAVLLALAAVWTVGVLVEPGSDSLNVLDPTWPLSQLGMVVLGAMVLRTGQWTGPLRWLPLASSLWLVPSIVGTVLGGDLAGNVVHAVWQILVYGSLGLLLACDASGRGQHLEQHPVG